MNAKIKLYKNDGKNRNGEFPIKLIITHKGVPKRETIGHSLEEDWDLTTELPNINHPDYDELYESILIMRQRSRKNAFKKMTDKKLALEFLKNEDQDVSETDFYKFIDELIQRLRNNNKDGLAESYDTAKRQLQYFIPELAIENINKPLIEKFKVYKKNEGIENSSLSVYLRSLRAIYNKAIDFYGITDKQPFKGAFKNIPVRKRRKKNRWLDKEQLIKLATGELEKEKEIISRDLTMLQFYLGGADLMDVYYLNKNMFFDDRVMLQRKKLGEKGYEFDVKVFPEAKKIIDKYSDPNRLDIFPFKKEHKSYTSFRRNHLKRLKVIQEKLDIQLLPLQDGLTTKVIRHSFATIGKFLHIDEDIMREIMGHERDDIDTIYKDKYPEEERDEAHLKIISLKNEDHSSSNIS